MNKPEIKIQSENSLLSQWSLRRFFYKREGRKDRINNKAVKVVFVLLSICIIAFAMFIDVGNKNRRTKAEDFKLPPLAKQEVSIQIHPVDIENTKKPDVAKRATRTPQNTFAFVGLKKVDRFGDLKIPPGTMIKAQLLSGASNGPVRARMLESINIQGATLIERGQILLGQGISSQERLFIKFSKLVFNDGNFIRISAEACDQSDQMPGLFGSNVRGVAMKWVGAASIGVLGGAALGMHNSQN
ncbi:MAG: TrbI/VirB10 family protein, partial [Oligoflexales bacterium]|nr:TrbI/VirB10 family protein [Oligoflexales bacterium]